MLNFSFVTSKPNHIFVSSQKMYLISIQASLSK